MVELLLLLYGGSALLLRSSRSFVLWMWMLVLHDFCNWLSYGPYAQLGVGAAVLHFPTIASLLENQRAYIADPAHAPPIGALFPITGVDATAGACLRSLGAPLVVVAQHPFPLGMRGSSRERALRQQDHMLLVPWFIRPRPVDGSRRDGGCRATSMQRRRGQHPRAVLPIPGAGGCAV